ncbi:MAG TPA: Vms1/Ankzf1 family peptidyl-tRNA hydrolase [Solirubrobacteraceae bacterium]
MSSVEQVRRLIEHRGEHQVISLYLDLDPERFATPPARASQIRSLVDEGARKLDGLEGLSHQDRVALRDDLKRVDSFLSSPEAPFKGARSLALFCSGPDDLFEVIQLTRPVAGRVAIGASPYVEPMITAVESRVWLVALVNRRSARLLAGSPDRLQEHERVDGDVPGQQHQGGWSQANYERSIEKDAMDHLRTVAEIVNQRWLRERFDRVAVGGPQEVVARFEEFLSDEVRGRLVPQKLEVDLTSATDAQVRAEVEKLVVADDRRTEEEVLDRLQDGLGAGSRAAAGIASTLEALNERRVQTLLLAPSFDRVGWRCQSCALLLFEADGRCPADGQPLERVEHLREAVVEAAVFQDADVVVVRYHDDREPREGIAAVLRF